MSSAFRFRHAKAQPPCFSAIGRPFPGPFCWRLRDQVQGKQQSEPYGLVSIARSVAILTRFWVCEKIPPGVGGECFGSALCCRSFG